MLAPLLTALDYARALRALLPYGRVWPRDEDTGQFAFFKGLGPTYERLTARANNLLVDSFPLTTIELLPEWEATLGLPDPCAGPSPTIEARRAQVIARFTAAGGQSQAWFISFAGKLGYTISITNYSPFRVGFNTVGQPLYGQDWAYAWTINAPLNTVRYFRAGNSAVGEPLAYWTNVVLECELNSVKPAHMVLLFSYS